MGYASSIALRVALVWCDNGATMGALTVTGADIPKNLMHVGK